MKNQFDELTENLAQSVTRRAALKKFTLHLAGMALACFGLANMAEAAPIPGLFNTGVNPTGTPLPDDAVDPHYRLVAGSAVTGQAIVATSANSYPVAPCGPWLGDAAVSAWATPSASAQGLNAPDGSANCWYETRFDLTGLDPANAKLKNP